MVISNAIICDATKQIKQDICIEDGVIKKIADFIDSKDKIDANGAYLLPALVDTNVRLKDSILNSKNIKQISKDAKEGGVGLVVLNADSNPAIDNEVVLEYAQNSLHNLDGAKIELMLNATQDDGTLSNIAILLKEGAIVPYMSTITKNDVAIKISEYVKMYNTTLFCKAEDNSLKNSGVMLESRVSSRLGLAGISTLSEILHVSRMIEIARYFNIKIVFKSIATPRSIELINQAKKEGVEVQCEVSINHLMCSDEYCQDFNTTAKLNPPLAMQEDVLKLQQLLKDGKIDILTTLHQPSSLVNKEVAFFDANYGSEAIKEALPLYYTKLVKSGLISMSELIKLSVLNPAKTIGLDLGKIEVGKKVDLVLFDPTKSFIVKNNQSLFNNQELFGEVRFL
jgi:dihydroorotase